MKALDGCALGKAVELKADGDKNAFLSGPLEALAGHIKWWLPVRLAQRITYD